MKIVGEKIYDVCGECGKIVRLNKWCGSLHICSEIQGTPEQINYYRNVIIPKKREEFEK